MKLIDLRKNNNDLDKLLNKENSEVMTDMIVYLRGSALSEMNQELVRHDLLDMVLSAQERGDDIKSVIGSDYKGFCDEIIHNLPPRSKKENTLEMLSTLCLTLSILLLIHLVAASVGIIFDLLTHQDTNLLVTFTFGNLITFILIPLASFFILHLVTKDPFSRSKKAQLAFGASFVTIIGISVFMSVATMVGKQELFHMHLVVGYLIDGLLFLASYLLNKMKNNLQHHI